ncbi:hypothetical protein GOP47_0004960 [Adiantum capillus-veneris]|uniref:Uncharacterized protein n=1 Tax=Adiantum capillus-veneris TaxID=13818 RepID=A0A9D4ZN68_ADICA|nr:hypothetical protein GOP47_0004960 [Adiantum capillus-veneris]
MDWRTRLPRSDMVAMVSSVLCAPPPRPAVVPCARIRASSQDRVRKEQKVQLTNLAVSATTELLRLFSPLISGSITTSGTTAPEKNFSQLQDVMDALKIDYDQAYFLTGRFTRSLYADDCYFADPTISFTGMDLYGRNLRLLIPFLEEPSLTLFSMNKEPGEGCQIRAVWQLRTRLKLPWRPIIRVSGSTIYTLNEQLKVTSHVEIWNVPVLEALFQIFRKGDNGF